ncbi:hypothetical protein B0J12DRAFT_396904 [Macrophomina phaseolina]|uniref:Uncharacterized protein n=1 Tax=Macrophomina phaseolina TaxID=35725 RepID=A0ABQ8GIG5_9PEZI|nr:hypothetical protein B0J12DRAFT_396904 [Macrophomina phaseolina]
MGGWQCCPPGCRPPTAEPSCCQPADNDRPLLAVGRHVHALGGRAAGRDGVVGGTESPSLSGCSPRCSSSLASARRRACRFLPAATPRLAPSRAINHARWTTSQPPVSARNAPLTLLLIARCGMWPTNHLTCNPPGPQQTQSLPSRSLSLVPVSTNMHPSLNHAASCCWASTLSPARLSKSRRVQMPKSHRPDPQLLSTDNSRFPPAQSPSRIPSASGVGRLLSATPVLLGCAVLAPWCIPSASLGHPHPGPPCHLQLPRLTAPPPAYTPIANFALLNPLAYPCARLL